MAWSAASKWWMATLQTQLAARLHKTSQLHLMKKTLVKTTTIQIFQSVAEKTEAGSSVFLSRRRSSSRESWNNLDWKGDTGPTSAHRGAKRIRLLKGASSQVLDVSTVRHSSLPSVPAPAFDHLHGKPFSLYLITIFHVPTRLRPSVPPLHASKAWLGLPHTGSCKTWKLLDVPVFS